MQKQISEIFNQMGFVFLGTVGQRDAYTVSDNGTIVVTDEFGLTWEIPELALSDEQKCEMCGRRQYVSHIFAPQQVIFH